LTGLVESGELVFEKSNSIHGFIVFSDSQDKDVGGFASLIFQSLDEGIDSLESTGDPLEIGRGISNLSFDVLSVSNSGVVDTTVGGGDSLEIRDGSGKVFFLLIVLFSQSSFFIID
jgi:hypothetical protein